MTVTLVIVPAEKIGEKQILKNIFATVDVKTWEISPMKNVLTHTEYSGKVRFYAGGYLTVSADNEDYEALTLGAFINLLHRRAKSEIKAITIVF